MAVQKTRITRNGGGGGDDFVPHGEDQLELGSDVALVGDPGDGANIIAEDVPDEKDWDLPSEQRNGTTRQKPGGTGDETPEFDEEDSRLAYTESGEQDDDTPQGRSRRTRRNERRRQAQAAASIETENLRRQVEQLTGVVTRLATGQQGLAVNTLDAQVSTLQGQLRVVDDEMANAIKTSDGDTYSRAQRIRDEIVGRLYAVQNHRARMAAEPEQTQMNDGGAVPPQQRQQQQQQQRQQTDPRVEQFFDRFMDRYDWFDPTSPDANCNIVRAVDQELVTQGYQRNTPLFWRELERKLTADYGLKPGQTTREADDVDEDERPGRREVSRRPQQRPPTNGGRSTSSGRGAGFRLTDTQTNILREEGLLEENLNDADKAKRQRIVDKWKRGDQAERRGASR